MGEFAAETLSKKQQSNSIYLNNSQKKQSTIERKFDSSSSSQISLEEIQAKYKWHQQYGFDATQFEKPMSPVQLQRKKTPDNRDDSHKTNWLNSQPISIDTTLSQVTLQRREYPDDTEESQLEASDWTSSDRVYATDRWQTACILNLNNMRPQEYTQPHERRDFYLWFYNYTSGLGWETRWPLAAYVVAGGAARLSYGSIFDNQVQIAARQGNQIIFDDVFPKLYDLLQGGPLKGVEAQRWDAQTLSDEQQLVQSMYSSMSQETIDEFAGYARQEGFLATLGAITGFNQPHRGGRFHRVQAIPGFRGDIMDIDDRFDYGMELADQFSTHPQPLYKTYLNLLKQVKDA